MKKTSKIIAAIFLVLIIGIFIHPRKVYYEAKISGKVIDENGNPIENAVVSRIEEISTRNKEWGYYEYTKYKSQTVKTDKNGNFVLNEKSKIKWVHIPFHLPFVWCYADFEISKNGFELYKTEFRDFSEYNEKYVGCKNIIFEPIITLKKNDG